MKEKIDKIFEVALSGESIISTVIQSIPVVGAGINQLIFGSALEIRLRQIEKCIEEIKMELEQSNEDEIDKDWCSSIDFLQIFKFFIEKIEFEASEEKLKFLSKVFAKFILKENSKEKNKFYILLLFSQMSIEQIEILKILNNYQYKYSANIIEVEKEFKKIFEKKDVHFHIDLYMLNSFRILNSDRDYIKKEFTYTILQKYL